MYALNINKETNRIMSVTYSKYATKDMVIVDTLPDGDISDYIYSNGEYIYDPLPKTVPETTVSVTPTEILNTLLGV